MNTRGVERSRLVVRVKASRVYNLKLWFLADRDGQISRRNLDEVLRAIKKANEILNLQSNASFHNLNAKLAQSGPVPQLTGPKLQTKSVGLALQWPERSVDIVEAFLRCDKTYGSEILANMVWINRLDGIDADHAGGHTMLGHDPILIFVTDLAQREIQGEVLAHALLNKHSKALGYDNGHSTNEQDLMFSTAERHGRIRLRLDEVQFINP